MYPATVAYGVPPYQRRQVLYGCQFYLLTDHPLIITFVPVVHPL